MVSDDRSMGTGRLMSDETLEEQLRAHMAAAKKESLQYQSGRGEGIDKRLSAIEEAVLAVARVAENAFHSLDKHKRDEHGD
jgi:hypothetical protein